MEPPSLSQAFVLPSATHITHCLNPPSLNSCITPRMRTRTTEAPMRHHVARKSLRDQHRSNRTMSHPHIEWAHCPYHHRARTKDFLLSLPSLHCTCSCGTLCFSSLPTHSLTGGLVIHLSQSSSKQHRRVVQERLSDPKTLKLHAVWGIRSKGQNPDRTPLSDGRSRGSG